MVRRLGKMFTSFIWTDFVSLFGGFSFWFWFFGFSVCPSAISRPSAQSYLLHHIVPISCSTLCTAKCKICTVDPPESRSCIAFEACATVLLYHSSTSPNARLSDQRRHTHSLCLIQDPESIWTNSRSFFISNGSAESACRAPMT